MADAIEIAWAAGLFEGEGSFSIQRQRAHKTKFPTEGRLDEFVYANASLATTDRDVIERFASIVGVGKIHGPHKRTNDQHKPIYVWNVSRRDEFEVFAEMIRPFLGERRLARMNEVIAARTPKRRERPKRKVCLRGHLLEGKNVKVQANGGRACRKCIAANARKKYAESRLADDVTG